MPKIVDYYIVCEDGISLEVIVLKMIKQGWQPLGSAFVRESRSNLQPSSSKWYQTMVKYEKLS